VSRLGRDTALNVAILGDVNVFNNAGIGRSQGVRSHRSAELADILIEIEQEGGSSREIAVRVEYAQSDGVRLAVVEERREGCEVDAIGPEIHSLNAGDRAPEIRVDAASVDPRIDGGDAGGGSIDGDFGFAERCAGAAEEFVSNIVGHAGVPEFVVGLALGEDIEEDSRDVGGEGKRLFEKVGGCVEGDRAAGGASREGDDLIGGAGRRLTGRYRIEEQVRGAMEHASVGLVDEVEEIDGSGLRNSEDGAVVGEIALHVPVAGNIVRRLGGGSEIDVGGADPDVGSTVELTTLVDGEVGLENDFGPGAGTGGGWRVGETFRIEVCKNESLVECDYAGCGFRTRHIRIGEGGIAGTNFKLSGGDGGEQD
jgi:hypothetical protein